MFTVKVQKKTVQKGIFGQPYFLYIIVLFTPPPSYQYVCRGSLKDIKHHQDLNSK